MRSVFRTFWAHDREAERQALIDFVAWLDCAPPAVARPARLPLRALRDGGPAPAGRPPRRLRGRGRPAAARRGVRRPLRRRPVGDPGVAALLLDQEARAALHGGPRGRRHQRRRLDRRLPPVHGGPRRRAPRRGRRADRRDRRLQPRRLRLDVDAARLAARAGRGLQRGRPGRRPGRGRRARGGPDPLRAAARPDPARDPAARPARRHQAARALGGAAGRGPGGVVGAVPRPGGQAGVAGALRASAAAGRRLAGRRRGVPRRVGGGRRTVAPGDAAPAAPTHAAARGRADARHPGRSR